MDGAVLVSLFVKMLLLLIVKRIIQISDVDQIKIMLIRPLAKRAVNLKASIGW